MREPRNHAVRAVPFPDLRKPVVYGDHLAIGRRGHIAGGKSICEHRFRDQELTCQLRSKAAVFRFDDGARVMSDQAAQRRVSMLNVAEVAGTVERMKAGIDQFGRVPDVVQPCRGFEQVGVVSEYRHEGAGSCRDTLNVRPATRERDFEELACEFFGPVSLLHASKANDHVGDVHGRGMPSRDVSADHEAFVWLPLPGCYRSDVQVTRVRVPSSHSRMMAASVRGAGAWCGRGPGVK